MSPDSRSRVRRILVVDDHPGGTPRHPPDDQHGAKLVSLLRSRLCGGGSEVGSQVRQDGSPGRGPLGNLTDRELQVFELIGRGQSTAAIADHLEVSVKTIETYRSHLKIETVSMGFSENI